jgi:hypothetical protein
MKFFLIFAVCVSLAACRTSSGVAEASPNHFKWYVDEMFSGPAYGINELDKLADDHCRKYKKRAIWSSDFAQNTWLKYVNYDCVPEERYVCKTQIFGTDTPNCIAEHRSLITEPAKQNTFVEVQTKCDHLGFKRGTEKFEECMLQLQK